MKLGLFMMKELILEKLALEFLAIWVVNFVLLDTLSVEIFFWKIIK